MQLNRGVHVDDPRTYYVWRALEEDEAARKATCPEARKCHEELAAAYRRKCFRLAPFIPVREDVA